MSDVKEKFVVQRLVHVSLFTSVTQHCGPRDDFSNTQRDSSLEL